MSNRPPRKAIPIRIKRLIIERQSGVCKCGCNRLVSHLPKTNTHFDHEPALILRDVNESGTDYLPPQHDPDYIDARCPDSHRAKTHGTGATTAGTDIGKRKKERKRSRPAKFKRRWPRRNMAPNRKPRRRSKWKRKVSGEIVRR